MKNFKRETVVNVCKYYDSKNISYSQEFRSSTNETVIKIRRDIGSFKNALVAVAISKFNMIVTAEMPQRISAEKIPIFLEFVARANSGIQLGHFGIDIKAKRLYYRVASHWTNDVMPNTAIVTRHINICIKMLRYYSWALASMQNTDISASEAIGLIEK